MSGLKFCPHCGEPTTGEAQEVCLKCGATLKKKKKDNTALIVIIVVCACILPTLTILGVVAAITIPSLINRQNEVAARTKVKKAIATYNNIGYIYMTENGKEDLRYAFGKDCENAYYYFKVGEKDGCTFKTADGAFWEIDPETGNAAVSDNKEKPQYSVTMWNGDGEVNKPFNKPENLMHPSVNPQKGVYTAEEFMYVNK